MNALVTDLSKTTKRVERKTVKIGVVSDIDDDGIWVQCSDDDSPINVLLARWDNTKYCLDPATDAIVEEVVGSFEQYRDKDKYLFESYLFYEHGWEYIPCWKLEGIPSDGIYHSILWVRFLS